MRALIILLPLIIAFAYGWWAGRFEQRKLIARQLRELQIRRSADAHLRADALDRMDAEPYARVVYDELTNTEREISS